MVWIKFLFCAVVIFFAGTRLAKYADVVAEKTGLGRVRVGMLVLAVVTSMPELVTSVSATALVADPDLAFGTLAGTCIFNLWLLTVMDGLHTGKPVLSRVSRNHMRLAGLGAALAAVFALALFLVPELPALSNEIIGVPSVLAILIYTGVTWFLFRKESAGNNHQKPVMQNHIRIDNSLWVKFGISAAAIIGGGIWLSYIGEEIARETGWGASFIGSLFLAVTTSLPELTVALAAVRMKAVDLALADILGANTLDLTYIAVNDLIYDGQFFSALSRGGIVILGLLVVMNLVIISAIKFPREKKLFVRFSWYSPLIVLLYIFGAYVLFISGGFGS